MKTQIENAYRALPVVGLFAAIGYISGIGHGSQYVAGCVDLNQSPPAPAGFSFAFPPAAVAAGARG